MPALNTNSNLLKLQNLGQNVSNKHQLQGALIVTKVIMKRMTKMVLMVVMTAMLREKVRIITFCNWLNLNLLDCVENTFL